MKKVGILYEEIDTLEKKALEDIEGR